MNQRVMQCHSKQMPQYGCGHERLNSRFRYYECQLPADHDGPHADTDAHAQWADEPQSLAERLALGAELIR